MFVVGVCVLEFYLRGASSLKEKRRVLKSIITQIQSRYRISVAEVDHQGSWKRATLAVAMVSSNKNHVYRTFSTVTRDVSNQEGAELLDYTVEFF